MPIEITPITERDIPGAVDCIQRAFEDDPYNNWVFDKSCFSVQRNAVSLGLRCRWGMQHALFSVAKDTDGADPDQIVGVSCWLPPRNTSAVQTWSAWAGDWWLWCMQGLINLRYGRGGLILERYWIWKAAQAQVQGELWTDPAGYYFCNIVTVMPAAQGKGIGKLLFRAVTDMADREGRPCYLESSRKEPNTTIYERLGFVMRKEMVCDDNGAKIMLYCMTREPMQ